MDVVSDAFSRAFINMPLDMANFLMYCHAYNVLLPGIVMVASMRRQHSGTKRPSNESHAPGRDMKELAINDWIDATRFDGSSDFYVYTEIMLK